MSADRFEFNVTFNNISVVSRWSVLLVEKTTDLLQVGCSIHNIYGDV
jgi:hypothetical protein